MLAIHDQFTHQMRNRLKTTGMGLGLVRLLQDAGALEEARTTLLLARNRLPRRCNRGREPRKPAEHVDSRGHQAAIRLRPEFEVQNLRSSRRAMRRKLRRERQAEEECRTCVKEDNEHHFHADSCHFGRTTLGKQAGF